MKFRRILQSFSAYWKAVNLDLKNGFYTLEYSCTWNIYESGNRQLTLENTARFYPGYKQKQ